ncbi:MAG: hypothetical protein QOG49_834 [Frankiaceae bacterium]|nr:hypothetical protein [Frankiaceae bacterium]
MARWTEFAAAAPDVATYVTERFAAGKHKTMATLRADGSPRISGTEITIERGDLWIAGLPQSRKLADLRRDARVAIHSASPDPAADGSWPGDAKVSGLAVEVTDPAELATFASGQEQMPPGPFELFRLDLHEVVAVRMGEPADHLDIDLWQPGQAARRFSR